jgi:predicted TIM-barrel fold metal-dependent hydrolase
VKGRNDLLKYFDVDLYLPGVSEPGVGRLDLAGPRSINRLAPLEGYGMANYGTVFTKIKTDPDPAKALEPWPLEEYLAASDAMVAMMDAASVVQGVLGTVPNFAIGAIAKRHPGRVLGFPSMSPWDGMRGVKVLEEMVQDGQAHGLRVSSLYDQLPASDRRYYPLYAKCAELDLPVRIYAAMTYANDRPFDLGHPQHIDQVAMDFPELRIIAGLGGWPWVMETVALVRRHPKLYVDTGAHRPKYLAAPGSGWEPLMRYGNTVLQDKVMVGLSWIAFGTSMQEVIDEYRELPLKDAVKEKWMYGNAARFFGLNDPASSIDTP